MRTMTRNRKWLLVGAGGSVVSFLLFFYLLTRAPPHSVIPINATIDLNLAVLAAGDALRELPKGSWLLEAPQKMTLGESRQVRLAIAPNEKGGIQEALGREYQTTRGRVSIGPRVLAALKSADFEVTSLSNKEQPIASGAETSWNWII